MELADYRDKLYTDTIRDFKLKLYGIWRYRAFYRTAQQYPKWTFQWKHLNDIGQGFSLRPMSRKFNYLSLVKTHFALIIMILFEPGGKYAQACKACYDMIIIYQNFDFYLINAFQIDPKLQQHMYNGVCAKGILSIFSMLKGPGSMTSNQQYMSYRSGITLYNCVGHLDLWKWLAYLGRLAIKKSLTLSSIIKTYWPLFYPSCRLSTQFDVYKCWNRWNLEYRPLITLAINIPQNFQNNKSDKATLCLLNRCHFGHLGLFY